MEKSLVGDPVLWPGLIYSPLNNQGLIFAVGTIAEKIGLIFEELHDSGKTAICRRKAENGWQRIRVALELKSSEFSAGKDEVDLLICWVDDSDGNSIPIIELINFSPVSDNVQKDSPASPANIIQENVRNDFLAGKEVRESFEETIRELDSRIKNLKSM
ncbi:MAG: hypothetical protein V3W18_07210 [candidate division Zixibacteria bacterium]